MIRVFQSKILLVILGGIVAWLGIGVWRVYQQKEATDQQVANVRAKMEQLQQENDALKKVIGYLKNPEYIAREARLKLNFRLPDEQVAYVYPEEKKQIIASLSYDKIPSVGLAKIKDWFYNLLH